MSRKIPVDRLSFQETCAQLGLTESELMRCVAEGLIVPMAFIEDRYTAYSIEVGADGARFSMELHEEYVKGCYYLVQRVQRGLTRCEWRGFSASRTAEGGEMFYAFDGPYSSTHLPDDCCFSLDEIARFRREYGQTGKTDVDKPLHPKERATVQKLIIAMAMGGYGYDPAVKRSDVSQQILEDVEKLGLSLDADTVRKWLTDAAKQLL